MLDGRDEALVAEIADGERFGGSTQGHERHDFTFVDIERQRPFARDFGFLLFSVLVNRRHREGEGTAGVSDVGTQLAQDQPPVTDMKRTTAGWARRKSKSWPLGLICIASMMA